MAKGRTKDEGVPRTGVRHGPARRRGAGARHGQRGQSSIEFLLAVPLVLILLSGIFEFGRHFYTRLTLRHAVAEAARFAVTGSQRTDPGTGDPLSRAESIVQVIVERAHALDVDVSGIQIKPPDGGGPGDVVQISARYRYTFVLSPIARVFGPGHIDFTVATVVKNEPVF